MHASYESSSSVMAPFFANQSCDPFQPRDRPCELGKYVRFAVNASGPTDVQRAVAFAASKNIRLVIRNTGHGEYSILRSVDLHVADSFDRLLGSVHWCRIARRLDTSSQRNNPYTCLQRIRLSRRSVQARSWCSRVRNHGCGSRERPSSCRW